MAPIIYKVLKPKKLLFNNFPTVRPKIMERATLVRIIVAPLLAAAGIDLKDIVPPMTNKKAPAKAPDPSAKGVVKPPIFNRLGKKQLL